MELSVFFKSVIDQDRAPVVLCDLDHTILYMNPAAIRNYEKRGGEKLIGQSLLACHNPHSQELIKKRSRGSAKARSTTSSTNFTTKKTTAMFIRLPCVMRTAR